MPPLIFPISCGSCLHLTQEILKLENRMSVLSQTGNENILGMCTLMHFNRDRIHSSGKGTCAHLPQTSLMLFPHMHGCMTRSGNSTHHWCFTVRPHVTNQYSLRSTPFQAIAPGIITTRQIFSRASRDHSQNPKPRAKQWNRAWCWCLQTGRSLVCVPEFACSHFCSLHSLHTGFV